MGYGMDDLADWSEADEVVGYGAHPIWEAQAKARYALNKDIKVGNKICCASCGKKVTKKSYQSQFCSSKGRGNCKDYFWNRVDRKRLERALAINEIK